MEMKIKESRWLKGNINIISIDRSYPYLFNYRRYSIETIFCYYFSINYQCLFSSSFYKKCNFPRLYIIKLSLYSALVTFIMAGIIWYTSNNTLFGFVFSEEQSKVINKATSVFTSKLIESDINFDGEVDCPDPNDEDNYTIEMDRLHNGSESDKLKYRACLEKEIRSDLSKGI